MNQQQNSEVFTNETMTESQEQMFEDLFRSDDENSDTGNDGLFQNIPMPELNDSEPTPKRLSYYSADLSDDINNCKILNSQVQKFVGEPCMQCHYKGLPIKSTRGWVAEQVNTYTKDMMNIIHKPKKDKHDSLVMNERIKQSCDLISRINYINLCYPEEICCLCEHCRSYFIDGSNIEGKYSDLQLLLYTHNKFE